MRQTTIETELVRIRICLTWLTAAVVAALVATQVRNRYCGAAADPELRSDWDSDLAQIESVRDERFDDLGLTLDNPGWSDRQTLPGGSSKVVESVPATPVDNLEHLTVAALRDEAKRRGLATSGNRSALLSRLRGASTS